MYIFSRGEKDICSFSLSKRYTVPFHSFNRGSKIYKSALANVHLHFSRISAFLSSALFYFGYIPEKMTPLIRPIVDCLFVEENEIIASEVNNFCMQ